MQPIIPDRPGTVIHVGNIFQALLLVYVVFLALFVKWLKPNFWSLWSSILLGVGIGLLYSLVHAWNKSQRASLKNLVRMSTYALYTEPFKIAYRPSTQHRDISSL